MLFAAGLVAAPSPAPESSCRCSSPGRSLAAVAGDSVGYAFGARLGRPWLERRVRRRPARRAAPRRAEAFYERFGWFAVVAARWIPWVRTFTPILAGAAPDAYRASCPPTSSAR